MMSNSDKRSPDRAEAQSAADSIPRARRPRKTYKIPAPRGGLTGQISKVTEVRAVRTAYGFAKLQEASRARRFLVMRQLPEACNMVPYVEGALVGGAYFIAPDRAMSMGGGVMRYPVLDVVPAIFIDKPTRVHLLSQLATVGLQLRFPEEIDLTASVTQDLHRARVLYRNPEAVGFAPDVFAAMIVSVKASPQFDGVYLIETHDGACFVMAVDRLIESVMDLHPYFVRVHQPSAVRLQYLHSQNTWIARISI